MAGEDSCYSIINRQCFPDLLSVDFIQHCRAELAEHQVCRLPNFLTSEIIASSLAFATNELTRLPRQGKSLANIYYQEPWSNPDFMDPVQHKQHAVNRTTSRSNTYITADRIPTDMPLRELQTNPTFQNFLDKVTGEKLVEYGCEVSKFVFSASSKGDHQDWHFDNNFLTLTFMLQEPEDGGELEVHPLIGRENYNAISAVLDGSSLNVLDKLKVPMLERFQYKVGDMVLFYGRESLHRALPVNGDTTRIIGIISYSTEDQRKLLPNATHYEKVYSMKAKL